MKKIILIAAAAASILSLNACKETHATQASAPVMGCVKAQFRPDVTIGEDIKGSATVHAILGIFTFGTDTYADNVSFGGAASGPVSPFAAILPTSATTKATNAAAFNATKGSANTVIIAPSYKYTVEDYYVYAKVTCDVTGKKGTITKIEQVK